MKTGMFGNRRRAGRGVRAGASPVGAGGGARAAGGPWRVGSPLPSNSRQPILSPVTCGCVCNKRLTGSGRACFLGPGVALI